MATDDKWCHLLDNKRELELTVYNASPAGSDELSVPGKNLYTHRLARTMLRSDVVKYGVLFCIVYDESNTATANPGRTRCC